jgi:hypothetical protein
MWIKALSIKQPWAGLIANGGKSIETRLWETKYRGPLLIVSSKLPDEVSMRTFGVKDNPGHWIYRAAGKALAVADLVDCRPMVKADELGARCDLYAGAFSWVLKNVRPIEPFSVKGSLGIYTVRVADNFMEEKHA